MPGETQKRKPLTREELEAKREALNKSRGQHDVMKQQFENFQDSISDDFKKNMKTIISEEDLEAIELESDPVKVFEIFERYKQKHIDDEIEEKRDDLEAFEDKLHQDEQLLSAYEIEAQFGEENPDLDFDGMLSHLEREMSPAKKEQLLKQAEGDNLIFLNLVKDDFVGEGAPAGEGGDKGEGEGDPDLPADLNDVAGETGDLDSGDGSGDENTDFLEEMGMDR